MPIPMSRPSWKKLPAGPILRVIENTRDEGKLNKNNIIIEPIKFLVN